MVERSDVVLAVIPILALAGPLVASAARALEAMAGVGGTVTQFPLTPMGLMAALLVIVGALFTFPAGRR